MVQPFDLVRVCFTNIILITLPQAGMDDLGDLKSGQNAALVILAFLQADCGDSEYSEELYLLGQEINFNLDINCNGFGEDSSEDGYLESDGGHLSDCITDAVRDIHPSVGLPGEWLL